MDPTMAGALVGGGAAIVGSGLTLLGTWLNSQRSDRQAAQRAHQDYLRRRHERFDDALAQLTHTTSKWARNEGITLRALNQGVSDSDPQLFWLEYPEGHEPPSSGTLQSRSLEDLVASQSFLEQNGVLKHDQDFFAVLDSQYETITGKIHYLRGIAPSGNLSSLMEDLGEAWDKALTTQRYLEHAVGPWNLSEEECNKAYLDGLAAISVVEDNVQALVKANTDYVEQGGTPAREHWLLGRLRALLRFVKGSGG